MDGSAELARAHVTSEHARVRELLDELGREALGPLRHAGYQSLRERLGTLRAAIDRAIEVEERELVPLLRTADAWGPVRIERVRERHARLLSALEVFEAEVAAAQDGGCDVLARTQDIVGAFSSDLDEEHDALVASQRAEVVVVVDQETD